MNAQQLKAYLTLEAAKITDDRTYSEESLKAMRGLAAGTLTKWIGGKANRKTFQALVLGVDSIKSATPAMLSALLDAMGLEKDTVSGKYAETEKSAAFRADANEIVRVELVARGQMELA